MRIFKIDALEIKIDIESCPKPEPILWYRQGIFCLIPIEIIQNAIDQLEMYQKFSTKHTSPIITVIWDQGIPVDPKVGYALLGEESNN